MIENGAIIEKKSNSGYTPLYFAEKAKNTTIVTLLKAPPANKNVYSLQQPTKTLAKAITDKDLAAVKANLSYNPGVVNVQDNDGRSFLYNAAKTGFLPVVQELVERGANIHLGTKTGFFPFYVACEGNFLVQFFPSYLCIGNCQVFAFQGCPGESNHNQWIFANLVCGFTIFVTIE